MMTLVMSSRLAGPGEDLKEFRSRFGFRISGDVLFKKCEPGGTSPEPIAFYEPNGALGCWRINGTDSRYRDLTVVMVAEKKPARHGN